MKELTRLYSTDNTRVTYLFPIEYRTEIWNETFGIVENELINFPGKFKVIEFDFSECSWCDPLPLLSVLILGTTFSGKNEVRFIVPNSDEKAAGLRLYSFLLCEGFLRAYRENGILIFNKERKRVESSKNENDYQKYLLFKDSFIIPPTLFDIDKLISNGNLHLSETIKLLLQNTEHRLRKKVPLKYQRQVINSLILFLNETISNSAEHAYDKGENRYVSFYVRFRQGITNASLSSQQKEELETSYNAELKGTKLLSKEFAEYNSGFIEIFVFDAGKGLLNSFANDNKLNIHTLKDVLNEVVIYGTRNIAKEKETQFGGLYILTKLIDSGFIWIKDRNEVFADKMPIRGSLESTYIHKSGNTPKGFPIIARLAWKQSTIQPDWRKSTSNIIDHPYFNSLESDLDIYKKYLGIRFRDFVNGNPFYIKDKRFDFIGNELFALPYLENKVSTDQILFLPPIGLYKNQIHEIISSEFLDINNKSKTIIIADIPDHETGLYQYALDGAKYKKRFIDKFDKIILVSRSLELLVLTKQESNKVTYTPDRKAAEEYFQYKGESFSPDKSFYNLLEWIKTHDTLIYWSYIFKGNRHNKYFYKGEIEWTQQGKTVILGTYFDFASTLSIDNILKLYDLVLSRLSGFISDEYSCLEASDSLVKNIVDIFNTEYGTQNNSTGRPILINSVWVTGLTIKNAGWIKPDIAINFLVNKSTSSKISKEKVYQLLLWPDQSLLDMKIAVNAINYKRVGSSPFIAINGWKYYTIPRYKHKRFPQYPVNDVINLLKAENKEILDDEFIPSTVENPKETYLIWQSPGIVSYGHFEYGGYHDLFKIDIPFAFEESFNLQSHLFLFVLQSIISAFNIDIDKMEVDSYMKERLTGFSSDVLERNDVEYKREADIVVYPFHFAAEHIFRRIKQHLPEAYRDRVISLMPLQYSSATSTSFYSPQVIENIKQIVKGIRSRTNEINNDISAIIFDTVRVNGKTGSEIEHILKLSGIENIRTILILDRSRMPLHGLQSKDITSFWRMDVPVLGGSNNCIICKALDRLSSLRELITNRFILDRMEEIIKNWSALFRYSTLNDVHGIDSSEIVLPDNGQKRYGVYVDEGITKQIGGDKNRIAITNSHGLAIFCAEMLSMTTKDDLILEIISNEDHGIPSSVIIEAACTILLLYRNQMSRRVKTELLKKLYFLCRKTGYTNNHSALCAITLIAHYQVIGEVLKEWITENGRVNVEIVNTDVLIAVCCIAKLGNIDWLLDERIVRITLSSDDKSSLILRDFHRILFNDHGDWHNLPLQKIRKSEFITPINSRDGFSSLVACRKLIEKMDVLYFLDANVNLSVNRELDKIDNDLNYLGTLLEPVREMKEAEVITYFKDKSLFLLHYFNRLYSSFILIHEELYCNFDLKKDETFSFKDKISDIVSDFEKNYKKEFRIRKRKEAGLRPEEEFNIVEMFDSEKNNKLEDLKWDYDAELEFENKFEEDYEDIRILFYLLIEKPQSNIPNLSEKWVPWNSKIKEIVKDIISDSRHISEKTTVDTLRIDNSVGVYTRKIIGIENGKYYTLRFVNVSSNSDLIKIKQSIELKKQANALYMQSINGSLELQIDNSENVGFSVITINLNLPFM